METRLMTVLSNRDRFRLEVLEGGWAAACMDPADWQHWLARNPLGVAKDKDVAVRPCRDCPLAFAIEMRAQDRCNGQPGTNDAATIAAPTTEETSVAPTEAAPQERVPTGGAAHRFTKLPADRGERIRVVLDAVRSTTSHTAAGIRLGVSGARIEQVVSELRRNGQLPDDVDALLRARTTKAGRAQRPSEVSPAGLTAAEQRRAQVPRERPTADRSADPEVDVAPGDAAPAPAEVGASAAAEAPELVAGLPCTTCAHEPVCGLKPVLEAWIRDTPRPLPPLPVLHVVAARLTVSCDHYLATQA